MLFLSSGVCLCQSESMWNDCVHIFKNISLKGSRLLAICLCARWNVTGGAAYELGRRLRIGKVFRYV